MAGPAQEFWTAPRRLDWPQEFWTARRILDSPKKAGLTQEESAGPKNLRVGAAEGRDGRPHPNAGLTYSKNARMAPAPKGLEKNPAQTKAW
ncbi:hypothetical protein DdX_18905 [Ditylenchus destructor]|uniref:Uncharacterized protein n=1 Tax=Ditylenchus destructor TaxID=166010 RepID=A0AAD4QXV5_9BILA|nr:hypothetical protein DdX_18905 [Ditylenchus destructor]